MPAFYDSVGEEPTYELAESVIRVYVHRLKQDRDLHDYSKALGYTEHSLEDISYVPASRFRMNNHDDTTTSAMHIIIRHFPNIIKKSDNSIYVKYSSKHLLNANDLLVMDYYLLLLSEYEERVNKYQQYLKKQQDRQRNKLLLVILVPFITVIYMLLVGD